jgi:hypothetical protein
MTTYNLNVSFYLETCCTCNMHFCVPVEFRKNKLNTGKTFYCPSGHPQSYTKPVIPELENKINTLEGRLKNKDVVIQNVEADYNRLRKQLHIAKKKLSKLEPPKPKKQVKSKQPK